MPTAIALLQGDAEKAIANWEPRRVQCASGAGCSLRLGSPQRLQNAQHVVGGDLRNGAPHTIERGVWRSATKATCFLPGTARQDVEGSERRGKA